MIVRKIIPLLFLTLFLYIIPGNIFAVSCCVNQGGEYACDYTTGELYCKDGTLSKDCTCRRVTSTPTPIPIPTSIPTLPSCIPNSNYDKNLKACKCNSGFIVEGNSCISYKDYCWHNFGSNTTYDSQKKLCVCSSGYLWDEGSKTCVTYNKTCQLRLGDKSYYNSGDNTCNCFEGFYIDNDECVLIPTPIISPRKLETKVVVTSIPEPIPTPFQEISIISSPTASIEPELILKDDGDDSFISEKNSQNNIVRRVIEGIWELITSLF